MPDLSTPRNAAIAIAATFTAEPLMPGLQLSLQQAGLVLDVRFAPYHQVFQELLSSTSTLATNMAGVDVLLVRLEDFVRDISSVEESRATIERTSRDLADALNQHTRRVSVPTVLAILPPSPSAPPGLAPVLQAASADLFAHARRLPGITLLMPEDIGLVSSGEQYDRLADELGHIPFTEEYYASLALAIARKVHAIRVPALKVLVLDCDETLWRGVVGEDGVDGITIPPPLALVQKFARDVQAKGVLVCLVSKNAEADVLTVFKRRADMVLKLEHIVAHRINWQPKPSNVASLARTLNLGLDSFVFIDDNPVECALMQLELPQVVTLQLPPDNEIESFLSRLWMFDKVNVTDEDMRRTSMYRENAARQELEEATTDIAEFITSLKVVVDIAQAAENEWPRVAQLTQRTNQFNFTTLRRSEPEMRGLANSGSTVLRVTVSDRFGDYGLVGIVIVNTDAESLIVDTFLLSCRVLGRGVEHTILRRLAEIARERKLTRVDLLYLPTSKNEPARAFAESVAANFRMEERGRVIYRIPADAALAIAHRPGHDPAAVMEALKAEENKGAISTSALNGPLADKTRSERYANLARTLLFGRDVLRAVRARDARARTLCEEPTAPATDTERKLLALWQEQLGVDGLGVEDDYFALGGTSLVAARLFAEITRRFGAKLRLTAILESPTVRALSRRIEQQDAPRSAALIELKRGGPRYFFLVHDGDGETLLYLNLARRMPDDFTVLGIEPQRMAGVPLAATRIEEMAACYIREMQKRQPHGPYLLGGMCAGGVIAYEMAQQLSRGGETVELVALLDAATPQAATRRGRLTKKRVSRLTRVVADARSTGNSTVGRWLFIANTMSRKFVNALAWEVTRHRRQVSVRARFRMLRRLLEHQRPWPALVPALSVRQIYDSAEHLYTPKPMSGPSIVLLRAQTGEGGDTPYREIYTDQTLGWGSLTNTLTVVDVDGGHSSMLQEPFAGSLADALLPHLIHNSKPPGASLVNGSDVEKSPLLADAQCQFADAQPEDAV